MSRAHAPGGPRDADDADVCQHCAALDLMRRLAAEPDAPDVQTLALRFAGALGEFIANGAPAGPERDGLLCEATLALFGAAGARLLNLAAAKTGGNEPTAEAGPARPAGAAFH